MHSTFTQHIHHSPFNVQMTIFSLEALWRLFIKTCSSLCCWPSYRTKLSCCPPSPLVTICLPYRIDYWRDYKACTFLIIITLRHVNTVKRTALSFLSLVLCSSCLSLRGIQVTNSIITTITTKISTEHVLKMYFCAATNHTNNTSLLAFKRNWLRVISKVPPSSLE